MQHTDQVTLQWQLKRLGPSWFQRMWWLGKVSWSHHHEIISLPGTWFCGWQHILDITWQQQQGRRLGLATAMSAHVVCGWSWGECTGAVHHHYVRSKNIKLFVIPKFFQNNHHLHVFLFWHWQSYIPSSFNFSNPFYQKEKFPSHSYPKKHKKTKSLRTMFFRR